jgi:hypothetical protein
MGTIERIAVGLYPFHGVAPAVRMALHRRATENAEMTDVR